MPASLLDIFKIAFLALLWLFFVRVLRAVWVSLREPAAVPAGGPVAAPAGRQETRAARRDQPEQAPASLRVVEPPEQRGRTYPLSDELTVGRGGGCGVALVDDRMVSQLHARVFRGDDGRFYIEDLGSTNGTTLNGTKVSGPAPMRRGDRLRLGRTTLEVAGPVSTRGAT